MYAHPWTPGNFADSLKAATTAGSWSIGSEIAGYTVVAVAAEEAHLLNLSVAGMAAPGPGRAHLHSS